MKKYIKKSLILIAALPLLSSCLKDDTMVLDPGKAKGNIIEFVNPAEIVVKGSKTVLYSLAYPIVTKRAV